MPFIEGLSWDEGAEAKMAAHGVSFYEVEGAVQNIGYAKRHRGYLCVIGRTDAGRYLFVVLDDEGHGIWYPVTARPATKSEKRLFRR